jgi:hypothetical protein
MTTIAALLAQYLAEALSCLCFLGFALVYGPTLLRRYGQV